MGKHWSGNTAQDSGCMFLILYLQLSWCRSKKLPEGNSDEKCQVSVKVWKQSTGSSAAQAQPQQTFLYLLWRLSSSRMYDMSVELCEGNGHVTCSRTHIRLVFCHTIIFFVRDDIGILLKTSSMLWMAPVFASELICRTAGDAAVILKHAPCILQPRGNHCSTYGPPLSILLLIW